jgi:hypothetical protein
LFSGFDGFGVAPRAAPVAFVSPLDDGWQNPHLQARPPDNHRATMPLEIAAPHQHR